MAAKTKSKLQSGKSANKEQNAGENVRPSALEAATLVSEIKTGLKVKKSERPKNKS